MATIAVYKNTKLMIHRIEAIIMLTAIFHSDVKTKNPFLIHFLDISIIWFSKLRFIGIDHIIFGKKHYTEMRPSNDLSDNVYLLDYGS